METFWMCYVVGGENLKRQHLTYEDACIEAERLAKLATNIERRVYVLEALVECVAAVNVTWNEMEMLEF